MAGFKRSLKILTPSDVKRETKTSVFGEWAEHITTPDKGFEIEEGYISVVVGVTGTGKTTLVRHLVHHNAHKFNCVWLLCPEMSRGTPEDYDWLPQKYQQEPSDGAIDAILAEMAKHPGGKGLLVLDDCIGGEMSMRGGGIWKKLGATARKFGLTLLVCAQKLNELDKNIRDAARAFFVTNAGDSSKDTLYPLIQYGFTGGKKEKMDMINTCQGKDRHILRFNTINANVPIQIFHSGEPPKFYLHY